jgi:lantibiotic transport system permease protein
MKLLHSIQSEWIKTKRSTAFWICFVAALFIPLIYLIVFFVKNYTINSYSNAMINSWEFHFADLWRNSSIFLLPMTVIFASSLITQIENKNNTWKQVHASPQSFSTVYYSKFSVILLMTLFYFFLFNIGIILSGIIPSLFIDAKFPSDKIPFYFILKENVKILVACLPIMAIQYLLSLQFKNFLVPIGIGFLGLVSSLIGITWKYIYLSPYSYCTMAVFPTKKDYNTQIYALIYFVLIMSVSFYFYLKKKDKS